MRALFVTLLLVAFPAVAQNTHQRDIDQQVWTPFVDAMQQRQLDRFFSVHSRNMVRAERSAKRVLNVEQYRKETAKQWAGFEEFKKSAKIKDANFELRFTERLATDQVAYEVGFYKMEFVHEDGKRMTNYGKFQATLQKEDGKWKILVDADTQDGKAVSEAEYQAAKPVGG